MATINGALLTKDNKFRLQPLSKNQIHELTTAAPTHTLPPNNYTWGSLDLTLFMKLLSQAGIYDAVVEQTPHACIVQMVCN